MFSSSSRIGRVPAATTGNGVITITPRTDRKVTTAAKTAGRATVPAPAPPMRAATGKAKRVAPVAAKRVVVTQSFSFDALVAALTQLRSPSISNDDRAAALRQVEEIFALLPSSTSGLRKLVKAIDKKMDAESEVVAERERKKNAEPVDFFRALSNSPHYTFRRRVSENIDSLAAAAQHRDKLTETQRQQYDQLARLAASLTTDLAHRAIATPGDDCVYNDQPYYSNVAPSVAFKAAQDRFNNHPDNANDAASIFTLLEAQYYLDCPQKAVRVFDEVYDNGQGYGGKCYANVIDGSPIAVLRFQFRPLRYLQADGFPDEGYIPGHPEQAVDDLGHFDALKACEHADAMAVGSIPGSQVAVCAAMRAAARIAAYRESLKSNHFDTVLAFARADAYQVINEQYRCYLNTFCFSGADVLSALVLAYDIDGPLHLIAEATAGMYTRQALALRQRLAQNHLFKQRYEVNNFFTRPVAAHR